jgi:hypothetical protein
LTWPNEVDFSADGLRHDAFPKEQSGEYMSWTRGPMLMP